jgi:hypothetical protein
MDGTASALAPASKVSATTFCFVGITSMSLPTSDGGIVEDARGIGPVVAGVGTAVVTPVVAPPVVEVAPAAAGVRVVPPAGVRSAAGPHALRTIAAASPASAIARPLRSEMFRTLINLPLVGRDIGAISSPLR